MLGDRLSHYRILEQVGAGGMGVVYRAHDEQLDRDVAIKVLPPGSLTDDTARKRFRKEALSLARLNHPNIATVHEFGSQDGIDFLVTEFIPGITLDTKLARGPLPAAEVMRLGLQLAAGLEAAHQQGIVHRDLKPGNLRLTTDSRLKILDFGLAQLIPQANSLGITATMTQSQETSGTLPYMAPELLSGEAADVRTDVWAAGAVLYELATGKRPFPQSIPALVISAILNQVPEPPCKINASVPPKLNAVILKALARDRAQRYQSASALGVDLEAALVLTSGSGTIPRETRGTVWILGIAALAVLLLVSGYFGLRRRGANIANPGNRRRSVAVLGFKNLSANPEKSWLSTAISEMLTTELSQGDQLRTIPGESVALMKASLSLPDTDSFNPQTLKRIRQNLGSDDVILGSFVPLGDGGVRVDIRLQDAVEGVTLASVSKKGSETEIDSLVSEAGAELRAKLGVGELSDAQSAAVRASIPSNPEAARLYSQGIQKLRFFDSLAARQSLERAAELVPDHAPTRSALAEAYSRLGYEDKAKEQAKKALGLSSEASREERSLIEGRAHELSGEYTQATENYRALWEFFPDNLEYGLFLIRSQVADGRGADAETTLTDLRKRAVSEVDLARVNLAEASIAASLADFRRQQSSAAHAVDDGRAAGANLLVAQALQMQAQAEERMGSKTTIDLLNQAKQLFDAAGDRRGSARVVLNTGDHLYNQGEYEAAKQQFNAALPIFREIGARKSIRATLERIGNVFYSEGKMPEAKKYYEQTLAIDREANDHSAFGSDYGNLANTLDSMGDLPVALTMQHQALDAFNQTGDRRGVSSTQNNLGLLFVEVGNLDEAKKYYDQALAMARESAYHRGEPAPTLGLGDILFAQGDLAGARRQFEQAQAMCRQMNEEDCLAQVNAELASVALAERRYLDGESLARQSAAMFEKANSTDNEAWAQAVLARNLLGSGKLNEAQGAASKAIQLTSQSAAKTPRFDAVLADARVKAKSGKLAEAQQELDSSIASAHKFGYRLYEHQLRLARGEIGLNAGGASAKDQLGVLERDATAHGAALVAKQARELARERTADAK